MKRPTPIFDSIEHIEEMNKVPMDCTSPKEFKLALSFLICYAGSKGTFNSYRREIERLFQWTWLIAKTTIKKLKREDIEKYIHFCQNPPKLWINLKIVPRFIVKNGGRIPNTLWRPFVATVTKAEYQKGERATKDDYSLSNDAVKEIFAILSSFFNYLLQEEYLRLNPVALIRQKSKFIRKRQGPPRIRRLTEIQWEYVIKTVKVMAKNNPSLHERTLFIMSALYSMYLRISELASSERWTPCMNHFKKDSDNNWWYITVGKGNKERQIAISNTMLNALKRWREYLGLSPLPSPADNSPLLPKLKGKGGISNIKYIREIVQKCFDLAGEKLKKDKFTEEADTLLEATVHWLRHTGISEDVKIRPREHVRDDAGHSSSATTDKYIDVELKERAASARKKKIAPKDDN